MQKQLMQVLIVTTALFAYVEASAQLTPLETARNGSLPIENVLSGAAIFSQTPETIASYQFLREWAASPDRNIGNLVVAVHAFKSPRVNHQTVWRTVGRAFVEGLAQFDRNMRTETNIHALQVAASALAGLERFDFYLGPFLSVREMTDFYHAVRAVQATTRQRIMDIPVAQARRTANALIMDQPLIDVLAGPGVTSKKAGHNVVLRLSAAPTASGRGDGSSGGGASNRALDEALAYVRRMDEAFRKGLEARDPDNRVLGTELKQIEDDIQRALDADPNNIGVGIARLTLGKIHWVWDIAYSEVEASPFQWIIQRHMVGTFRRIHELLRNVTAESKDIPSLQRSLAGLPTPPRESFSYDFQGHRGTAYYGTPLSTRSSHIRRDEVVARTPEEFAALWKRHTGDEEEPPQIDFSENFGVAIFRPTEVHARPSIAWIHVVDGITRVAYNYARITSSIHNRLVNSYDIAIVPREYDTGRVKFVRRAN